LGDTTLRLLSDPDVTEIYTNDDLILRTDGRRGRQALDHVYKADQLMAFFRRVAIDQGQEIDELHPIGDFELPAEIGGGRLHVTIPPSTNGPNLNPRKPARRQYVLADLVANNTLSQAAADYLLQAMLRGRTVLVAGPTNSGKTTLLNALLHAAVAQLDAAIRW